jgi:hypothetical protein
MRFETYRVADLVALLRRQTIATLPELKQALGTQTDSTLFRKLAELDYHSSYSHRGRFYVLGESCRFDELGLWAFRDVWFSAHGTLLSTAAVLVEEAEAGYHVDELTGLLHVETKAALAKLVAEERLARQVVDGRLLYLSADSATRRRQLSARQVHRAQPATLSTLGLGAGVRVLPDELKAAIVLFYSLLDERQRRLYAGLEAAKIGHGGDSQIAALLGVDPDTVARGRRELLTGDVDRDRVRRAGGGRPPKAPRT